MKRTKHIMIRQLVGILAFFIAVAVAPETVMIYADEDSTIDEDELFSDEMIISGDEGESITPSLEEDEIMEEDNPFEEDMVEEFEESELDSGIDTLLLKSETMELGGRYTLTITPSYMWQDPDLDFDYVIENIDEADSILLTTTLQTMLFFDARPDEDFRVFGKVDIDGTFSSNGEWVLENNVSIKELFADFTWKDIAFFRAGKQMIKWGVGYFFSPADVLNLTPIDPEDPEAEREGPVSFKMHIPVDIHNLYLYIIPEQAARPEEIAIAPKAEFVIKNVEAGIGGFYKKDYAPMGVLTLSFPAFFEADMFAEGVVSYGANKVFIEETEVSPENPFGITAVEKDDEFFFSGTIGFHFFLNRINTEWESVSLAGQYFFNGPGYTDFSLMDNLLGITWLMNNNEISGRDLVQTGKHYAACVLSWNEIFDSDFIVSVFWISNLSDNSGQVTSAITWNIMDYIKAVFSVPVFYGDVGDEFTILGRIFGLKLDVMLGNGVF